MTKERVTEELAHNGKQGERVRSTLENKVSKLLVFCSYDSIKYSFVFIVVNSSFLFIIQVIFSDDAVLNIRKAASDEG